MTNERRLREALERLVESCATSGEVPGQSELTAPHCGDWLAAKRALSEPASTEHPDTVPLREALRECGEVLDVIAAADVDASLKVRFIAERCAARAAAALSAAPTEHPTAARLREMRAILSDTWDQLQYVMIDDIGMTYAEHALTAELRARIDAAIADEQVKP